MLSTAGGGIDGGQWQLPMPQMISSGGDHQRPQGAAYTFPKANQDMWIRYWLAAGGVDPDKNVELLTADIPKGSSRGSERFFDGVVYEPTKPQAYLDSLKIKR